MNTSLHGTRIGADDSGVGFNKVADLDRPIEPDSSRIDRDSAMPSEFHCAGGGCFVDPCHGGAAVDFATPVDILWFSHKAGDQLRGRRIVGICLFQHLLFDSFAEIDAGEGGVPNSDLFLCGGCPGGDGYGFSVLVQSDEDDQAVAGAAKRAVTRVGGIDFVDNVHRRSPCVGDGGFHLDEMPGWYRAGEVDVPDVCRDAVGSGPPDSARVGSFVDPLENAPTVDAHRTREQDVVGGCKEPQCDAIVASASRVGLLGSLSTFFGVSGVLCVLSCHGFLRRCFDVYVYPAKTGSEQSGSELRNSCIVRVGSTVSA